jgi:hypothetical protein
MKRTILATLFLASISIVSANAQPSATQETATAVVTSADETPIKTSDLPEAVKKTLASDAYAKWTVSSASVVKDGGNEYFKVDLVNGEEKQTLKLDKEGQIIK